MVKQISGLNIGWALDDRPPPMLGTMIMTKKIKPLCQYIV
jgi:hypothetical protein